LEVLSFGRDSAWDIYPLVVEADLRGMRGRIRIKDQRLDFFSRLIGAANLENILAAAGVGFALGLSHMAIAEGIARLESVPGRLERIENDLGLTVLVDYAHTPDALERALEALRPLSRGRLLILFGCGGDRDRGKRPLMGEIVARRADLVVLTSDNPRSEDPLRILEEIEAGVRRTQLPKFPIADFRFPISNLKSKIQPPRTRGLNLQRGYFVEPDRRAAIRLALRLAQPGDLVLIAGKGHEDYQVVGSEKIHFDDREVAQEELRNRQQATGKRQ